MSILHKIARTIKPSRPRRDFGQGIEPTPKPRQWSDGGFDFSLTEDPTAIERCGGYPYTLTIVRDGVTVETHGFDRADDATLYAYCIANPIPSAPEEVPPAYYADEPPMLEEIVYHETPEDSLWWSQHGHEGESQMDSWLDNAAPDDYLSLGMEGGAL